MRRLSLSSLLPESLRGHQGRGRQWQEPQPKAAAYCLATVHGITNAAVLGKRWIGGGNTGRNTTIIRSDDLYDEGAVLSGHARKLWEGPAQELNDNVLFSQRGVLMLAHSIHDVRSFKRSVYASRFDGIGNGRLSKEACKEFCPPIETGGHLR